MNSYDLAERINRTVNTSITYKSDLEQFGKPEHWQIANKYGDCEDYSLLKRAMLVSQGFEPKYLHLACCWTETQDYHCVLIAETDRGVFALDNRCPNPSAPTDLPYRWHKAWQDGIWREISF